MLRSLRSLKAVKIKQVNLEQVLEHQLFALQDGGATHGLRIADPGERGVLNPMEVELASGSTWLLHRPDNKTLVSLNPFEPIIPLHRLVDLGYKIERFAAGCKIHHPRQGIIPCHLGRGSPTIWIGGGTGYPEEDGAQG